MGHPTSYITLEQSGITGRFTFYFSFHFIRTALGYSDRCVFFSPRFTSSSVALDASWMNGGRTSVDGVICANSKHCFKVPDSKVFGDKVLSKS